MPTLALTNSLSFDHLERSGAAIPGVRVLGTLGWIVAGLLGRSAGPGGDRRCRCGLRAGASVVTRSLLPPPAAYPAARGRQAARSARRPRARCRCAPADRSFATFLVGSFLVCIPLQFYYVVHQSISERDRPGGARQQADTRAGLRGRIHAAAPVVPPAPRRETHPPDRHGRVDAAVPLFLRRQHGPTHVDAVLRHPAARHVLRLLLRHRADLRRSAGERPDPRRRAGPPGARDLGPGGSSDRGWQASRSTSIARQRATTGMPSGWCQPRSPAVLLVCFAVLFQTTPDRARRPRCDRGGVA